MDVPKQQFSLSIANGSHTMQVLAFSLRAAPQATIHGTFAASQDTNLMATTDPKPQRGSTGSLVAT